MMAIVPKPESNGSRITSPPNSRTRATAAATSATPRKDCQKLGTWGGNLPVASKIPANAAPSTSAVV